jgi:hypothetical protein
MLSKMLTGLRWTLVSALAAAALSAAGCAGHPAQAAAPDPAATPAVAGQPGEDQVLFADVKAAADALVQAAQKHDRDALHKIFGPAGRQLVSGDRVEDRNARADFAKKAAEQLHVFMKDGHTAVLYVGNDNWPFPIPLVRTDAGKWFFDTESGKQEVLARRIGANELETIDVCRAYVQAQREYAGQDRDGSSVFKYAQRLVSTPGAMDGLYWESKPGAEASPLGPLMAQAALQGYDLTRTKEEQLRPFHGYLFRILTRQGPAAPGGDYNYVINGNMIAGFALVACPVRYGDSGVMTFIVSHQGKVYQKDLGPQTRQLVADMTQYNPDSTWKLVKD